MCKIEGCEKEARARGWCPMHYARWQRHGDPDVVLTEYGSSYIDEGGYVILNRLHPDNPTGYRTSAHRSAMIKKLGRDLLPHERIHHKNGNKQDNRLENLELWSVSQPAGQRVEDKLAWAYEIIAIYDGKVFKN